MARRSSLALSFLIATTALAACAAPSSSSSDDAEGQESNVTGGSSSVESPVVFLFDGASTTAAPKCVGALIDDKMAVTAKSCAKEGLSVARAADKDDGPATVTKVHVPDEKDADIAVVELDKALGGTRALLTHVPLREGYSVSGVAAVDGKGLFAPDKNDGSEVGASLLEEDASHAIARPAKGTTICDGDLGAPVCSETGAKIFGKTIRGTCGLSGIVTGRADAAAATSGTANACSNGGWKVAELGRYADFLKQLAPKAFEPLVIDLPILRNFPWVPDGLWGYETKGQVAKCKIDTTSLSAIAASTASAKITASVSFAGMDKRAAAFGRVGIAPKADPTNMRWFPARALSAAKGPAFDSSFEGVVMADKDGDYVVAFRASADGGETWTECDTDGIANGFSVDKALALRVGLTNAPPDTPPSDSTTPQNTPSDQGTGYSDPPPDTSSETPTSGSGTGEGEGADDPAPKNKSSDSSGCSVVAPHASGGPGASGLLAMGLAFAAAAIRKGQRRRRGWRDDRP